MKSKEHPAAKVLEAIVRAMCPDEAAAKIAIMNIHAAMDYSDQRVSIPKAVLTDLSVAFELAIRQACPDNGARLAALTHLDQCRVYLKKSLK